MHLKEKSSVGTVCCEEKWGTVFAQIYYRYRGITEIVQHFIGGVPIGARALVDRNLIWYGLAISLAFPLRVMNFIEAP